MALLIIAIVELTKTVLEVGDAVPCHLPWLFGVKYAPAVILLVWMELGDLSRK
jgi:hypothetical protein